MTEAETQWRIERLRDAIDNPTKVVNKSDVAEALEYINRLKTDLEQSKSNYRALQKACGYYD